MAQKAEWIKKVSLWILMLVFLIGVVRAECIVPTNGINITQDTTFCQGTYELPNGIIINTDNITLDCDGAVLEGTGVDKGIDIRSSNSVTVKNCHIQRYYFHIAVSGVNNIVQDNVINNKGGNWGIVLGSSYNSLIDGNTINMNNFGNGIVLSSSSSNNNITNNKLYDGSPDGVGIGLEAVNNNIIHNNLIRNFIVGLQLSASSHNNIIEENKLINNSMGIQFFESYDNIIRKNDIMFNNIGIMFKNHPSSGDIIEFNNVYNNIKYEVYNNIAQNRTVENNYWGTINRLEIDSKIFDCNDNKARGFVDYCPLMDGTYPNRNLMPCGDYPEDPGIPVDVEEPEVSPVCPTGCACNENKVECPAKKEEEVKIIEPEVTPRLSKNDCPLGCVCTEENVVCESKNVTASLKCLMGCELNNKCVIQGTRVVTNDIASYCDIDSEWQKQKEEENKCQNNYECKTNFCSNNECYNISKEINETKSLLQKILGWLKRLFGFDENVAIIMEEPKIEENNTKKANIFENISKEELYACETDSDCVEVQFDCCGCTAMGKSIAINKSYQEDWNSNLGVKCEGSGCAQAMSEDISCFSEPKCLNNTCKLVPAIEELCDSLLLLNCKHSPENQLDNVQTGNGISCRDVIESCK